MGLRKRQHCLKVLPGSLEGKTRRLGGKTGMQQVETGDGSWYALAVKPRHEKSCAWMLRSKGLEDFVPLYRQRRRWSDRMKEVELPLFPGYVFCRFVCAQRFAVLSTPGVAAIVGAGNKPVAIGETEIESLRSVVRSGLSAEPCPFLEAGTRVKIIDGPLEGLEGILLEAKQQQRLVLSVALLRRSVAVEVDRHWVTPAAALGAGRVAAAR